MLSYFIWFTVFIPISIGFLAFNKFGWPKQLSDVNNNKIKEYVYKGKGISGNPQRNYALSKITNPNTLLYYLDDDNIIHPDLYKLLDWIDKDKLNQNNQPFSDGVFDYVPFVVTGSKIENGGTINRKNGRIFFSTVEPFGKTLANKLQSIGVPQATIENIAYFELYDSTKTAAPQIPSKNRFLFKGEYLNQMSEFGTEHEVIRVDNAPIEVDAYLNEKWLSSASRQLIRKIKL